MFMNKRASVELVILGLVAVIAVIGLIMMVTGATGKAAGQPQTKQILPNEEELRIERPLGWRCDCQTLCVYDDRVERAVSAVTQYQPQAAAACTNTLKNRCAPQPMRQPHVTCRQTVE
jgi:hypothetical protein